MMLLIPLLQTAEEAVGKPGGTADILTPSGGLMVWTLVIFVVLMVILSRYAFKPITAAVERREQALADALESAKRDRDEAAKKLEEQRAAIEKAHAEAMQVISQARAAAENVRRDMLEQARVQGQELLERARQEIDGERRQAIADLRRETVELAIHGASKVIEQNLDDQSNRALVEKFLSTIHA